MVLAPYFTMDRDERALQLRLRFQTKPLLWLCMSARFVKAVE